MLTLLPISDIPILSNSYILILISIDSDISARGINTFGLIWLIVTFCWRQR